MSNLYLTADTDKIRTLRTACAHHWIKAHARGWNSGAELNVSRNATTGVVTVEVWRTDGSNGAGRRTLVCSWQTADAGDLLNLTHHAEPMPSPSPDPLAQFGADALRELEADESWSGDTFDAIATHAYRLGLASNDDEGFFRRVPMP